MAELVAKLRMEDGGFTSGIASATSSLQKLDKQATLSKRGLDNFFKGQGADQIKESFDGVGRVLSNLEKKMGSAGTGMKQQLRAMTVAAQELEQTYRNLSAAEQQSAAGQELRAHIDELISKAGELKDTMGDVQGAISFASSDTAQLQAIGQGLTVLSAGAQVATGALSLFGVSEEKVAAVQQTIITLIGITNGLQTIQNALQKESALMQFLSIARTQGLAVALGLKTAAQVAETGATEAATVAQLANNAAVMANPYVACAVAIAALVGGIALWISSLDEATESEIAAAAAADALSESMDTEMKKAADQISAFMQLKNTYDECGGSVDQIKKKIIQNTDAQKKAGIQVKNLDQATRIFSQQGTDAFIRGCTARAQAMAAEAAVAAMLAKVMKELGSALAKVAAGEEVNIADVEKIAEEAGIGVEKFKQLARAAGFYEEHVGPFARNNFRLLDGVDAIQAQQDLLQSITKHMMENGAGKILTDMAANWKVQASIELAPYDDVVESAEEVERATKGAGKSAQKSAKDQKSAQQSTRDEVVKTLKTLEGCDAIIQDAEKSIKKLDKTASDYAKKKQDLQDIILIAKRSKLDFFKDGTTPKELTEYVKLLKEIKDLLPSDSEMINEINEEIQNTEKKIKELKKEISEKALALINTDTFEDLASAKKQIAEIIQLMDIHDPQIAKLARKWHEINNLEKEAKQTLDDMMNGIDPESPTAIKRKIQELENEKLKLNPEVDWLAISNIDFKIDWLKGELGRKMAMINGISVTVPAKLDITFDYKKSSLEKYREKIDYLEEEISKLNDIKLEDVGDEVFNKAQKSLRELREELQKTKREANLTEIKEDMKEYAKTLGDSVYEGTKNFVSGINSVYSSISGLSDKLDDAKNGFEAFVAVFDTVMTIFDAVKSTIETIKGISQAFNFLSGATQAYNLLTDNATKSIITQSVALTESAVAQTEKTAADGASTPIATANAAALKTQAIAATETAASLMFAAHASIPFVGAALGAAQVGIMEGVLAALKASVVGLFAGGGIVGGSSWHGDRLYARVNSGEMILNQKQQSNLFRMLDGGHSAAASGNVEFKLKGQELVGVIKNYNDKKSKLR